MENETQEQRPLAVVTGASSGIGYELAKVFAKNGFDLVLAAEDAAIVEAGDTCRRFGAEVETIQADLAKSEGVERVYQKIQSLGRPVDSLVLNAGVGLGGAFIENDFDRELNMIQLNIISTVHLAKLVLKDMASRHHGRILFTSSIAAEMPGPYYAVYAASKSFIQSFSEALRNEMKDQGVTITALQPGPTDTHFFARADMLDTKVGQGKKDSPEKVAKDGFEALMAGKDHVVAGSMMNAVQAGMAKFLSEEQAAAIHAKQSKPLSQDKNDQRS